MHDCAPSLRACDTQGVNKSQQEKQLIICVYHNTELHATFTDQGFF